MKSPTRAWPKSSACDGPLGERTASRQFAPQSWTDGSRQKRICGPDRPEFFHSPRGPGRTVQDINQSGGLIDQNFSPPPAGLNLSATFYPNRPQSQLRV